MCFPDPPKAQPIPKKEDVTSQEDVIASQMQAEKQRRGFSTTIATGGAGVTDPAQIRKTQLGA